MAKFGFLVMVAIFVGMVFNVGLSNPKSKTEEHSGMSGRSKRLIVKGEDAIPHEFPWTVFLFTALEKGHKKGMCSGSLISPRIVLTAAHCIRREGPSVNEAMYAVVYTGRHKYPLKKGSSSRSMSLATKFDLPPLQTPHENYTFYDYGVAILEARLNRSKKVDFIPLADSRSPPAQSLICYSAGFGDIRVRNKTIVEKLKKASDIRKLQQYMQSLNPDVLQKLRYKVVPLKQCYEYYIKYEMKSLNFTKPRADEEIRTLKMLERSFLCGVASGKSSGIRNGDSGGPLMCRSRSGPWALYGVNSKGMGDGLKYALFSRVSAISEWLKKIVAKYDPEFQLDFATASATQAASSGYPAPTVKVRIEGSRHEKLNLNMVVGINAKVSM